MSVPSVVSCSIKEQGHLFCSVKTVTAVSLLVAHFLMLDKDFFSWKVVNYSVCSGRFLLQLTYLRLGSCMDILSITYSSAR